MSKGHEAEISKVCFNSKGNILMTGSSDTTVRLWDVESGTCKQILVKHNFLKTAPKPPNLPGYSCLHLILMISYS